MQIGWEIMCIFNDHWFIAKIVVNCELWIMQHVIGIYFYVWSNIETFAYE